MIISGCHFNRMARFRIKWWSNALALCAFATIFFTQSCGSHRKDSMPPTGLSQNECFLLQHCVPSRSISSTFSQLEQNCSMQPRLKKGGVRIWKRGILSRLRIIEYVQYSVASGQLVPQGSHVTEESYLCILITVLALPSVTPRDFCLWQDPSRPAISYAHIQSFC